MNTLREHIGVSLQELEIELLAIMREQFGKALTKILENIDEELLKIRDSSRYKVKERLSTTIETLLGQQVTFTRRYYFDEQTGQYIFLLDEILGLPKGTQISPALEELLLHQAAITPSYRTAADSLEEVFKKRLASHEVIRQSVIKFGKVTEQVEEKQIQNPNGKRRTKLLFIEADGLYVPLQKDKKRSVKEFTVTIHEGWQPRTPGSKDYSLVNLDQYRSQDGNDFWDRASRYIYSTYDIDENTLVIINGDRAPWIRKGVDYFPNALYQVDRYHLVRDLRRLYGARSKSLKKVLKALDSNDITGVTFITSLAQNHRYIRNPEKQEKCERLIDDLLKIADSTVDYRKRLKARGYRTEGLRGLGAGESQMARFAGRVKGKKSWSRAGLSAMMQLLSWRNTGRLEKVTKKITEWMRSIDFNTLKLNDIMEHAVQMVFADKLWGISNTPIAYAGTNRSGGMSNFIHRLNDSALPT